MFQKIGLIARLIFLGILLSYLMNPLVNWIQGKQEKYLPFLRKKPCLSRAAAVFSGLFSFFLLFLLGMGLLFYNGSHYFDGFSLNHFLLKMQRFFDSCLSFLREISGEHFSHFYEMSLSMVEEKIGNFLELFVSALLSLPSYLGQFFIGLILSLYLLMEKNRIFSYGKKMGKLFFSSETYSFLQVLIREFHQSFAGYLKGQALDALIMSVLLSVGLGLIGVPLGISIGIVAGIGNFVPYLGGVLGYTFTTFFCLIEGKIRTLLFALLYLFVVQLLDGNYIGPRLLGNQTRLRPVLIFISVLAGGTLFGPLGMVFAVPFTGLLKSVIELLAAEKNAYTETEDKEQQKISEKPVPLSGTRKGQM